MHDKFLTNASGEEPNGTRKKRAPHCVVRHHSVTVPIYAGLVAGKTRYTMAFYRDGKRTRRSYTDLEKAKKEAKLIAEKILRGMQGHNDLKPAEREAYFAAQRMAKESGVPLVSAMEEWSNCRKLLGEIPLHAAVEEFLRRTNGVRLGVAVPQVVEEMIAAKEQDGMSHRYSLQLRSILGMFAKSFPGPIMHVQPDQIDTWLRKGKLSPVITEKVLSRKAIGLAKSLGLSWPNNVLRHSYISYRLATIQDANQVALEAGNSPAIIFRHYRELVTEEAAGQWFGITPPDGWVPPEEKRQRRRKREK